MIDMLRTPEGLIVVAMLSLSIALLAAWLVALVLGNRK